MACRNGVHSVSRYWLEARGGWIEWLEDDDADRSWMDDAGCLEGGDDGRPQWGCVVHVPDETDYVLRESLWSIDLGWNHPSEDDYAREVETELISELMARLD